MRTSTGDFNPRRTGFTPFGFLKEKGGAGERPAPPSKIVIWWPLASALRINCLGPCLALLNPPTLAAHTTALDEVENAKQNNRANHSHDKASNREFLYAA